MAITIKDIALESGYAVSTVSRVLNNHPEVSDKARNAIMEIVSKRGFVPNALAQQLPKRKNQLIGIVVKGTGNLFFSHLVEKMEQSLFSKGYFTVVIHLSEGENEIELAHAISVSTSLRGIFFLGGSIENFSFAFNLISVPSVLIACQATTLGFSNLSSVSSDDTSGATMAINHLIENGHRNIGILGGNPEKSYPSKLRYAGCLQGLFLSNIPFLETCQYQQSLYSYKSGYDNMVTLHHKFPDMTAVFAMGDTIAIGAINALRDMNMSVPEDVSIVGFDGTQAAAYYIPKITSVRQQTDLIVKRSIEVMLNRMQFKTEATHEIIPCNLIAGDSVKTISC